MEEEGIKKVGSSDDIEFRRRLSTSALLRQNDNLETLVKGDSVDLSVKPSELLPELSEEQRTFFYLIRDEDVEAVAHFMKSTPNFDVNCLNHQGTTALQEAVQRSNADMISLLLSQPQVKLLDCVLHAVNTGNLEVTEQLLDRWKQERPNQEFNGYLNSPSYTADTTPLILAAHLDDYRMIQMLLSRGHIIQPPHSPSCFCKETCFRKLNGEDLARSLKRLNAYRALASPAYISQTSEDPIFTCFKLAKELQDCALAEAEFRTTYTKLAEQVSNFAVQLLEYCRTTMEVESIVKRTQGSEDNTSLHFPYPRILMAIDLEQKKFIAHPKIQQVFSSLWLDRRHTWKHYSPMAQVATFVTHLLLLPILSILSIVAPCCSFSKFWNAPISKHINFVASYLIFLSVIILSSMKDKKGQIRGPPCTAAEIFIIIWVVGLTWAHFRQCWKKGFTRFMSNGWHWFDSLMLTAFYMAFACRAVASNNVRLYDNIHLPRKYWYQYDPTLVEESFTAIANILAFTRLLYLCQMSSTLGPLKISLGKMLQNVAEFLLMFAAIVISFALGMNRLFDYYKGMVQKLGNGDESIQQHSFVNLYSAFRTLFWTLFGLYGVEVVDVVIENLPGGDEQHPIINKHSFTQAMGYALYACYNVLCRMIIMSMLIAMMTYTYHAVKQSSDEEWKFARSKVWVTYILEAPMPPPFNLIPSASSLWNILNWVGVKMSSKPGHKTGCNLTRCCYIITEDENAGRNYAILMSALVQRYFRDRSEEENGEITSSSDVLTLTNQVRNFNTHLHHKTSNTAQQRIAYASEVSLLNY